MFYGISVPLWQVIAKYGILLHQHGNLLPYHSLNVGQASYSESIITFLFTRFTIEVFVDNLIWCSIVKFHLFVFRIYAYNIEDPINHPWLS